MRQSTPVRGVPVNVITMVNLSGSSVEATKGRAEKLSASNNELKVSDISASTFDSIGSPRRITFRTTNPGEIRLVENQAVVNSESSCYEEPDTPCQPPPLQ